MGNGHHEFCSQLHPLAECPCRDWAVIPADEATKARLAEHGVLGVQLNDEQWARADALSRERAE